MNQPISRKEFVKLTCKGIISIPAYMSFTTLISCRMFDKEANDKSGLSDVIAAQHSVEVKESIIVDGVEYFVISDGAQLCSSKGRGVLYRKMYRDGNIYLDPLAIKVVDTKIIDGTLHNVVAVLDKNDKLMIGDNVIMNPRELLKSLSFEYDRSVLREIFINSN